MTISGKTTFWQILKDFDKIEIPLIQRDYAQGRLSPEVSEIRGNFLESIKNSLLSEASMDLNFIYGTSKGKRFIPIDGQQRLTTLFLLHLYLILATSEQNDGEDILPKKYRYIKNFSYQTRNSSKSFCDYLTSKKIITDNKEKLIDVANLGITIRNNSWFSTSWENDPTVSSMLCMLDSIHKTFKNCDNLKHLLDLLTASEDSDYECPIYMYFLELSEYNLDDSIYIKLNARGKPLTDFENFKAKMSSYIKEKSQDDNISKERIDALNTQWSEFFWNFREGKSCIFDDKIMNFIIAYTANDYVASLKKELAKEEVRDKVSKIFNTTHFHYTSHFTDFDSSMEGCSLYNSFIDLFDLFNIFTDNIKEGTIKEFAPQNKYFNEREAFNRIIKNLESDDDKKSISITTRVKIAAYWWYLLKNKDNIDGTQLENWLRVIDTLARETQYNGGDDVTRALRGLKNNMLPHSSDILAYLSELTNFREPGFDSHCVKEECIKAILLLKSESWKSAILEAESNAYFNGQIGFLLEFSGIEKAFDDGEIKNWTPEQDVQHKAEFDKYFRIMSRIFGTFQHENSKYTGIERNLANALRRAILTKGDFSLSLKGGNTSFLVDNDRDISWKRLLRLQGNEMYTKKRSYLKAVIDDPLFNENDIAGSCNRICENALPNLTDNLWRYFIKYPKIMDYLFNYNEADKFFRVDSETIFLMSKSRLYGNNHEYYSFAAYCGLENCSKINNLEYKQAKGHEIISYHISFKDGNDKAWFIQYERQTKKFHIFNEGNDVRLDKDSVEDVIDYVNQELN